MSADNITTKFQIKPTKTRFNDLSNQTFSRLTVLGYAGTKGKQPTWICKCVCGKIKFVRSSHLTNNRTKSCGCLSQELASKRGFIHGESKRGNPTPEFQAYSKAKQRCENANTPNYDRYGGRGIEFHFQSYKEFLKEVGRRPSAKHSLDRIDNNGHYAPENIRWANRQEQARNRHTNALLTIDGITKCMAEWSEISGTKISTILYRRQHDDCDKCCIYKTRYVKCIHS